MHKESLPENQTSELSQQLRQNSKLKILDYFGLSPLPIRNYFWTEIF